MTEHVLGLNCLSSNLSQAVKEAEPLKLTPAQSQKLAWLEKEGFKRGFDRGHAEGLSQAEANNLEQLTRLKKLAEEFDQELIKYPEQLSPSLNQLALQLAKVLWRAEQKLQPNMIKELVNEALALLPQAAKDVSLHLHPSDVAICQDLPGLKIVADDTLTPGGCLLTSQLTQVDASFETRLRQVTEKFLANN